MLTSATVNFLSETILKKIENYENLFIPKPGFLGPIYGVLVHSGTHTE